VPGGTASGAPLCADHAAARSLYDVAFEAGDAFLFGPETSGLPLAMLETLPPEVRLRIPMRPGNRSLNLSNAAAVTVYEAWRQLGFAGSGVSQAPE